MFQCLNCSRALVLPSKLVASVVSMTQVRTAVITRNKKDNKLLQLRERAEKRRKRIAGPGRSESRQESGPRVWMNNRKDAIVRPRESAASLWLRKDKERQLQRESSQLGQNIKKLKEFTEQLKNQTMKETEQQKQEQLVSEIENSEATKKLLDLDVSTLVNNLLEKEQQVESEALLASEPSSVSQNLFEFVENEAIEKLPPSLIDKIGDPIQYISNKHTANWELMIMDMAKNGGMQEMTQREASKLIISIPKEEKHKCVAVINEMMEEAGIAKDLLIYNLFLSSYSSDKKYEILCESLLEEMTLKGIKPDLYTFSAIVKSHGISDNLSKINESLSLMRNDYGLEPNKQIYTSVLQTCVRLKEHTQAMEVFHTMKFLSQSTAPDARAYESIILSNVEDDNVEKALDLYDEMSTRQPYALKPTPETLLLLARGCALRKELFTRGWEFVFEYFDAKYEPNFKTVETMMHLAAKDGDVSFTRALFNTLMQSKYDCNNFSPGSVATSLLMLAYARFDISHRPVSDLNDRVRLLKSKTIDLTTFNFAPPKSPPFLPIDEVVSDKSIVAESNAIWAYIVLNFSDFINEKVVGSYLFSAACRGSDILEFKRRFEKYTFLDTSGIPEEKFAVEILEEMKTDVSDDPLEQILKTIKREPPAVQLSYASPFKLPRTSALYQIAITAAKNFRDLEFATKLWIERGKYRKSDHFRGLPNQAKAKQDFEFAQHMVSFFTEMKLLEDATMIVLSTQNQFNWEWIHVKPTYALAEVSGNEDIKKYLSDAVNNKNYRLRPQSSYVHKE